MKEARVQTVYPHNGGDFERSQEEHYERCAIIIDQVQ